MDGPQSSLLNFLAAPVVVSDLEGRVIFTNPAFERRFENGDDNVLGSELSELFAGGGREAVLQAVAQVRASGEEQQFRLLEEGCGYVAVASPIESGKELVGVVVLLADESHSDQRLFGLANEIREPLADLTGSLDELVEQTGGRRNERHRRSVERALESLQRIQKWSDELHSILAGRSAKADSDQLDAVRILRRVAGRMAPVYEKAGVDFDLLTPARLPAAKGQSGHLELAVTKLLEERLRDTAPGGAVVLGTRMVGPEGSEEIQISLVDFGPTQDAEAEVEESPESDASEAVRTLGGQLRTFVAHPFGRVVLLRLPRALT